MIKSTVFFVSVAFSCCSLNAQNILAQRVHFETGRFELIKDEENKLMDFITCNKGFDTDSIVVKAYCDDRGSIRFNQLLSEKRAQFIASLVVNTGSGIRVKHYGGGELTLTTTNDPDKQRAENRYAEITYYKTKPVITPTVVVTTVTEKLTETTPVITSPVNILNDHQKVGDKITLNKILFIGGRHQLLPESYTELAALTNTLKENTKYNVCILGHICCVHDGSDGLDFDTGLENLSLARARVICEYLVEHGIDPKRLSYKGMRGNYPTGRGDKYDRRVEVEITKINE